MRAARIEENKVVDIWEVPSIDCYGGMYTLVEVQEDINIGDTYVDGVFTKIPVVKIVPSSISSFQAKAALLNAGLLDEVESYLALESTPQLFRLAWKEVQSFDRSSPAILAIASAVGISNTQLDELFIFGASVVGV